MKRRLLRLAPFVLLALLLLLLAGVIGWLLRERITTNAADTLGRAMRAVAPPGSVAMEPLSAGPAGGVLLYPVLRDGKPVGWVCRITTREGYNGSIELLAGFTRDGRSTGLRVLRHHETPGIAGPVLRPGSDWLRRWRKRPVGDPPDAVSHATVTTRAVIRAVSRCVKAVKQPGQLVPH